MALAQAGGVKAIEYKTVAMVFNASDQGMSIFGGRANSGKVACIVSGQGGGAAFRVWDVAQANSQVTYNCSVAGTVTLCFIEFA